MRAAGLDNEETIALGFGLACSPFLTIIGRAPVNLPRKYTNGQWRFLPSRVGLCGKIRPFYNSTDSTLMTLIE